MAVGIRKLGGYLHGGMTVWRADRRPVERVERLPVEDLAARAEADPELQILDVRERSEWDAGHIPGSTHVPYHDIHAMPDGLDPEKPIAAICAIGAAQRGRRQPDPALRRQAADPRRRRGRRHVGRQGLLAKRAT